MTADETISPEADATIAQLQGELDAAKALAGKYAAEMRAALEPCPKCDFVESDGSLYSHCPQCQFRVTAKAWELFATKEAMDAADAVAAAENQNRERGKEGT